MCNSDSQYVDPTPAIKVTQQKSSESKRIMWAKHYFLSLARRAEVEPRDAELLSDILGDRITEYWEPALSVAMQAAESLDYAQVHPVLDRIIAKSLHDKPNMTIIAQLYNRLPIDTVLLKKTCLEVFHQVVKSMEEQGRVELYPVEYLLMLHNYIQRLYQVGDLTKAEYAARKAIDFARIHHSSDPEKFNDSLIDSLETLAIISSGIGRLDDARLIREEEITLLRTNPNKRANLAQSLNNYAGTLRALGNISSALKNCMEAVNLYREIVRIDETTDFSSGLHAYQNDRSPNLGSALIGLSTYQHDAEQYQESLASAKEAYDIFSTLCGDYPDQFLHHLGMAKHNMGMAKFAVSNPFGGLQEIEEAVSIYERLTGIHPNAYKPDYAHLLGSLALAYAKNNRDKDALMQLEKSANIYRALAQDVPEGFRKPLIKSLNNLKILYEAAGQNENAERIAIELCDLELPTGTELENKVK